QLPEELTLPPAGTGKSKIRRRFPCLVPSRLGRRGRNGLENESGTASVAFGHRDEKAARQAGRDRSVEFEHLPVRPACQAFEVPVDLAGKQVEVLCRQG